MSYFTKENIFESQFQCLVSLITTEPKPTTSFCRGSRTGAKVLSTRKWRALALSSDAGTRVVYILQSNPIYVWRAPAQCTPRPISIKRVCTISIKCTINQRDNSWKSHYNKRLCPKQEWNSPHDKAAKRKVLIPLSLQNQDLGL